MVVTLNKKKERRSFLSAAVVGVVSFYLVVRWRLSHPNQFQSYVNSMRIAVGGIYMDGASSSASFATPEECTMDDIRIHNKTNVTIRMVGTRGDRLGSNMALPLNLLTLAKCKGYEFCVDREAARYTRLFGLSTCPDNLAEYSPFRGPLFVGNKLVVNTTLPGTYTHATRKGKPDRSFEEELDKCGFDEKMRKRWGNMLLHAPEHPSLNATVAMEDLYHNANNSKTVVAVHIRRGDRAVTRFLPVVWDEIYVQLLQELRPALRAKYRKPVEVHLFSENYTGIDINFEWNKRSNWSLYEGLVDYFHLAPDLRQNGKSMDHTMDMELNLRDWRHFVLADVLVVGLTTFSEIAGLGRPSSINATACPGQRGKLTIYPCVKRDDCLKSGKAHYRYGWTKTGMDEVELIGLPEGLLNQSKTQTRRR